MIFNFRSISTDIKNTNPIWVEASRRLEVQLSESLNVPVTKLKEHHLTKVSIQIFTKKENVLTTENSAIIF